jgi:hypothetical protein
MRRNGSTNGRTCGGQRQHVALSDRWQGAESKLLISWQRVQGGPELGVPVVNEVKGRR